VHDWNLAEAKNKFSELVNLALNKGPQRVRRRKDEVVVISAAEYDRLQGKRPSFKKWLVEGETLDGLDLTRNTGPERDVKF
jgi:antitoxin Phd